MTSLRFTVTLFPRKQPKSTGGTFIRIPANFSGPGFAVIGGMALLAPAARYYPRIYLRYHMPASPGMTFCPRGAPLSRADLVT